MLPQGREARPAAPANLSIESDPPTAPVAVSFSFEDDDGPYAATIPEPRPAPAPAHRRAAEVVSEPQVVSDPALAFESAPEPEPAPAPERPPAREPERARGAPAPAHARSRLLLAWLLDGFFLAALTSSCVALALRQGRIPYTLDFLRDTAALWLTLLAALAVGWSWSFTAFAARTPGMALAGLRLRSVHGGPPTPTEALARALLALPSAGLGLSGFLLALFDARGQTLHDKLCGCVATID